jgi:hypothetical protein
VSNKKFFCRAITVILMLCSNSLLNAYALEEQGFFGPNAHLIVLVQGLSRSITYDLNDVIWNDYSAFHASFIVTAGVGTLAIGVASASNLGENADILYSTVGFVGIQPVAGLAYGSGRSISTSIEVPEVGVGVLCTAIIAALSGPDFPVTMSMNFSLSP